MGKNEKEINWTDDIKIWINEQPLWVQLAAKYYLKNQKIENKEIKNISDACIKEIDNLNEKNSKIKNKENINIDSILTDTNSEKFCIKEISNVVGVDALSDNQKLEFEPEGITVIYGDNGSGKSGYIRILKKVSNSLYKEEIKSNIYNDKSEEQKCKVRIEKAGTDEEIECDLRENKIYDQLKNIDIFDTKTSKGYTDEEKEPNFEPQILKLFAFLGKISERIKKEIEGRRVELKQYLIDEKYKNNEEIKKIYQIDEKTDINYIAIKFTDEDEKELKELNEKLLNRENDIKLIDYKNEVIDEVIGYFEKFKKFYSDENLKEIENSKAKVLEKMKIKNDFDIKIKKDLNDEDKNHLQSDIWKEMWKYARKCYDEMVNETGSEYLSNKKCPLCNQKIQDKNVVERMNLIDDAVNGKINEELNVQYQQYIRLISIEQTVDTESLLTKLKDLIDINEIEIVNNNLVKNFDLIQKLNQKNFEVLKEIKKVDILKVSELLNNKKTELENSKKEIEKSMQPDEQKEINKEIESLNIKKIISNNFDNIKENIEICKNNKKIDEVIKKLSTKCLTMKSREIAKYLITDTYVKNFNEELKLLKLKDLNIVVEEGKAIKGKNQYRIILKGKNKSFIPSDILSEGENRAVSLAAFFAESKGRTDKCPLIVDDPISSLDYNYERNTAERLVNVAKDRQVIIFTHRLSLVSNINEFAEKENIKHNIKHICISRYKKGIIDNEVDLITCGKIDKALNRLKDKLNQIKKLEQNDENYTIKKSEICQKFRNCIEKSVEKYLIAGTVMRFRKDVQTKLIRFLPLIKEQDCELIDKLMTKYSSYDHSMSDETPLQEISDEEIEKDINTLYNYIEGRNKEINLKR